MSPLADAAHFTLDPQLAADTLAVGLRDNIEIRLMNDARYWWLVLVPHFPNAVEWHDLPATEASALHELALTAAQHMQQLASADKMNIAALGNMVRQLHVHVIARHIGDGAWPGAVWGGGAAQAYLEAEAATRLAVLRAALAC